MKLVWKVQSIFVYSNFALWCFMYLLSCNRMWVFHEENTWKRNEMNIRSFCVFFFVYLQHSRLFFVLLSFTFICKIKQFNRLFHSRLFKRHQSIFHHNKTRNSVVQKRKVIFFAVMTKSSMPDIGRIRFIRVPTHFV